MTYATEGFISKMHAHLHNEEVIYTLDLQTPVVLNDLLGKNIRLEFLGTMQCVGCRRAVKKTFQQGYCFPCVQTKAACDLCIVKPELCHFAAGTCREPEWGLAHCMQKHIVYLANTSGLKVGITRIQNVPQRFIDQGATAALPIFEVTSRRDSGLIEVEIARHLNDKTNWRKMLQGENQGVDLAAENARLTEHIIDSLTTFAAANAIQLAPAQIPMIRLKYPVQQYPVKITSLSFDKTSQIEGILEGIKGQYLLLSTGVLNLRSFSGYKISFLG